jgi:hypothetical protein
LVAIVIFSIIYFRLRHDDDGDVGVAFMEPMQDFQDIVCRKKVQLQLTLQIVGLEALDADELYLREERNLIWHVLLGG